MKKQKTFLWARLEKKAREERGRVERRRQIVAAFIVASWVAAFLFALLP